VDHYFFSSLLVMMVDFVYIAHYWGQDCDSIECNRADIDTSGDVELGIWFMWRMIG
jgi:hypothetical protein